MDARYMAAHTRYNTKEEQRLQQERRDQLTRHAAQQPQKPPPHLLHKAPASGGVDTGMASRCQGSMCHDSLYSQDVEGMDHVFGPPVSYR